MGCTTSPQAIDSELLPFSSRTVLEIEGMTCPSCAMGVEYQLKEVDGVIKSDVDYKRGTAIVFYDESKVSPDEIASASTVYPATVKE